MLDSPMNNFYTGTKHMVKTLLFGLRNEIRATGTNIRVSVSRIYYNVGEMYFFAGTLERDVMSICS